MKHHTWLFRLPDFSPFLWDSLVKLSYTILCFWMAWRNCKDASEEVAKKFHTQRSALHSKPTYIFFHLIFCTWWCFSTPLHYVHGGKSILCLIQLLRYRRKILLCGWCYDEWSKTYVHSIPTSKISISLPSYVKKSLGLDLVWRVLL